MKIETLYTSVGINRTPSSLDWGENDLVCFAACHSIAVFDVNFDGSSKLIKTFAGHKARVNTVKWIKSDNCKEYEIISGSDDSNAIIWNIKSLENPGINLLRGHKQGVTCVDAIYVDNKMTAVTASADSTIKLWQKNEATGEFECFQTIDLNTGICFAVRMCLLPESKKILLAFTLDDDKIYLYVDDFEEDQRSFRKIEMLAGHEDWVRGLDFITDASGDLLLASSSQDSFIRLWRISKSPASTKALQEIDDIQIEERNFTIGDSKYFLSLESVLQGHENWVYGVCWHLNKATGNLQLLSSSMDKTMIIWTSDTSGIWQEKIRVGEVGGNTLGFYGGKFRANGKSILGHGYQGSFHLWHQSEKNERLWEPGIIISGHFKEVKDIAWEPEGEFLLSVSTDQTTRIHAPWKRENKSLTYHEIARPQVHGYDMQCLAVLSRYKFASGAEEKIIRNFEAPGNFVENFRSLCKIQEDLEGEEIMRSVPKGASVPSLGLSNKAVYEDEIVDPSSEEQKFKDEYPENYFVPMSFNVPPTEEYLMQNTLWPELQKLYGHGYELFALAATSDGAVIASSCKATTPQHAEIILWSTKTWKIIQKLSSHKLTVTQLKFSPDDSHLLSVSRDRRFSLFKNNPNSDKEVNFELVATTDKNNGIHGRIIWCCSWTHDGKIFATGSRDGKVVCWHKTEENSNTSLGFYRALSVLEVKGESVTALAFAHNHLRLGSEEYLLAIGLESGVLKVYGFAGNEWTLLMTVEKSNAHNLTINKLEFRPNFDGFHLASCGDDNTVRIFNITL